MSEIDIIDFFEWGSSIVGGMITLTVVSICFLWNYAGGFLIGYYKVRYVANRQDEEDEFISHTNFLILDQINTLKHANKSEVLEETDKKPMLLEESPDKKV